MRIKYFEKTKRLVVLMVSLGGITASQLSPSTSSNSTPTAGGWLLFPSTSSPSGPIPEVSHCNMEDLEQANDSQLYEILKELKRTPFFRTFQVNLNHKCPLSNHGKQIISNPDAENQQQESSPSPDEEEEEEEGVECASEGLPDLDPDAEPACHVQQDEDSNPLFGGSAMSSAFSSTSMTGPPTSTTNTNINKAEETVGSQKEKEEAKQDESPKKEPEKENEDEEEDFDCASSGNTQDLDLDEDDEPLCTLTKEDRPSMVESLLAMALETIRSFGWESEDQKQTYQWKENTDPVVSELRDDCDDDDENEEDRFWWDMCHENILEGNQQINLALNPERNTGYNGTHIWKAIYDESCLQQRQHNSLGGEESTCYEERVLYRLLSGLHASTTLSITKHYYPPSKRKNRVSWESNPALFMEKFQHNPEYLKNLHFSYVVLLRALQKASVFLYDYDIRTGNPTEDETTQRLLRRLLDSTILTSCQSVFTAFDESLMFQEDEGSKNNNNPFTTTEDVKTTIQQSFKGVFQNISSIFDCVQCQQCKLHGKLAMLGYGTALKILFVKNELSLSHHLTANEIVAFINTVAKFSESIREVKDLTLLYWQQHAPTEAPQLNKQKALPGSTDVGTSITATESSMTPLPSVQSSLVDMIDATVAMISSLAKQGELDASQENRLVEMTLNRQEDLLILAKYYHDNALKWSSFAKLLLEKSQGDQMVDAIIVGSGLAGMAAALNLLDRGGSVILVEKEHRLGGNSNKASSGINAFIPQETAANSERVLEVFRNDTIKSAGTSARPDLIDVLVTKSADAVAFLRDRVGVDLSLLAQLGGHSLKRTHRPNNGMAGAEIIYGMQKAVRAYEKTGRVKILVDTRVNSLITNDDGRVVGVSVVGPADGEQEERELRSHNVVLATGGFASDRSPGSYLSHYRPELTKMPATAGDFSTGDGIRLARALGAGTVDMDKVQIHPTGWVDPTDPNNLSKVLAAELMRGVGGILINKQGHRFCNELGTRAYVTDKMLAHDPNYAKTGIWNKEQPIQTFSLVLSSAAAQDGRKHVDLYTHKGLLKKLNGLAALSDWMGVPEDILRSTMNDYRAAAQAGEDVWGKTTFRGIPQKDLENEIFYAGTVTPVLHYCMGGITIDTQGNVLSESGTAIPGLHAAGEVTGGVHGNNRLGGNSLLECTVFGSIVGKKLPIHSSIEQTASNLPSVDKESSPADQSPQESKDRIVSLEELEAHAEDGWVAIHGVVYNLGEFAEEHPAGPDSILDLSGMDGTDAFNAVHSQDILEDFEDERIGKLETVNAS